MKKDGFTSQKETLRFERKILNRGRSNYLVIPKVIIKKIEEDGPLINIVLNPIDKGKISFDLSEMVICHNIPRSMKNAKVFPENGFENKRDSLIAKISNAIRMCICGLNINIEELREIHGMKSKKNKKFEILRIFHKSNFKNIINKKVFIHSGSSKMINIDVEIKKQMYELKKK